MAIYFHSESTQFSLLQKRLLKQWINKVVQSFQRSIDTINYIFCSDDYLLRVNIDHLDHHYFTDIITFQYHEEAEPIQGDIFLSIDRVRENAVKFETTFDNELHRVMIHGILHLLGFGDKTTEEKQQMRQLEDHQLKILSAMQ